MLHNPITCEGNELVMNTMLCTSQDGSTETDWDSPPPGPPAGGKRLVYDDMCTDGSAEMSPPSDSTWSGGTEPIQAASKSCGVEPVCEIADGGIDCVRDHASSLIRDYGLEENFQILDLGRLSHLYKAFLSAMPRVKPHYAVKSNPHPALLEALAGLGCGFDCASAAEVKRALAIGVPPSDVILANTCKCPGDLRYAASQGIHTMTFDCEDELDKIALICPDARLVLRIRADDPTAIVQLGEKFGADAATEAPALLAGARQRGLNVVGVSFHVGSGSQDPASYCEAIAAARRTFEAAAAAGFQLRVLDIGGGFYGRFDADGDVPLAEVAAAVNESLQEHFPVQECGDLEVIAEPGRFFAEACMTMFAVVHTMKSQEDGRRMYYISDGLHGSFAEVPSGRRSVRAHILRCPTLPPPADTCMAARSRSTVFGPTCDGWDRILEEVPMPRLRRGDWLQFPDHGAYSTALSTTFNGFAAAEAPLFHVWSNASVAPVQLAMQDLDRKSQPGCAGWQVQEGRLCLTASPQDLGIHCS